MKVLMTADTLGGVLTYSRELARGLSSWGCRVTLATMGGPLPEEKRAPLEAIPDLDLHESDFRLEWMADPWGDVGSSGRWLLRLEEEYEPDVIHLNGYSHASLPWSAPVLTVAHSCVLSWWRAVRGEAAPPEWERYRRHVARGLRAADLVVAPTQAMLDALRENYGALPPSTVIPNGVDMKPASAGRKEEIVLCAAGRLWDEAKNAAALDAVAGQIPWPVFLAGETLHPAGRRTRLENVWTLGPLRRDELEDWYARALIYAHPALYEPFGYSVLEAANSGCALVLGDIPSLRECWEDSALFVSPGDPSDLRDAVLDLIGSPGLLQEMAGRARVRARRFTAGRMAARTWGAYRSLTGAVPGVAEDLPCAS